MAAILQYTDYSIYRPFWNLNVTFKIAKHIWVRINSGKDAESDPKSAQRTWTEAASAQVTSSRQENTDGLTGGCANSEGLG